MENHHATFMRALRFSLKFGSIAHQPGTDSAPGPCKNIRLAVEALEDRFAPAIFIVTTTADTNLNPTANSSQPVSLRDAITAVNADQTDSAANPDVIQFNIPFDDSGHFYYKDNGIAGSVSLNDITPVPTLAVDGVTPITSNAQLGNPSLVGVGNTIDPDWQHSWWTITPQSALPTIINPVIINGYTQSGAQPNTAAALALGANAGDSAILTIELNGASAGSGTVGLTISAGNSTVKGLVINGFVFGNYGSGEGIGLTNNGGDALEGNYIGTDTSGTTTVDNGDPGVLVGCSSNTIAGNVICNNNTGRAIIIAGGGAFFGSGASASDNVVQGNYIGTNAAGNALLGGKVTGWDRFGSRIWSLTTPSPTTSSRKGYLCTQPVLRPRATWCKGTTSAPMQLALPPLIPMQSSMAL